jgi:KaiC/GvpD/RAD55 family RecA-like ATPase
VVLPGAEYLKGNAVLVSANSKNVFSGRKNFVGEQTLEKQPEINVEEGNHLISMPEELMQFIQRDTYSLLIKGYAGAGKTTLALTILRALGTKDNFFYISTRISPKELFSYYPWLSKFAEQSTRSEEGASEHALMPTFEDARLDEPESLFERITNQLMDIKSPIIIIDSWDAIASFMDKEGRLNNERVLQTWRERAGAKLIFISEHPDDTTLDFLVGGVVELRQRYHDNTRFREIVLLKLRGVRIDRPSYIYTLEDSVFRSFEPYVPPKSRKPPGDRPLPKRPIEILSSTHIKSGFPALDRALGGGFPKNGFVLLEHDERISATTAISVFSGLVSNFVSAGNPVFVQPSRRSEPQEIMETLGPSLPAGKRNLLKILWTKKFPALGDNIFVVSNKFPARSSVLRLKKKYQGKLVLNIMAGDISSPEGGENSPLEDQILSVRASDLSLALVSSARKEQFEYFSGIADIHLRLVMISNTLFLHPILPASTLYAVQFSDSRVTADAVV